MQPNTKPNTKYEGSVRSALARIRRELKRAGYEMGRTEGRYHPFASTQKVYPGMTAHRVGVSRWIAVDYSRPYDVYESAEAKAERHRFEKEAFEFLRSKGLPLDERGWLECLYY
jgi:hypothetical protein